MIKAVWRNLLHPYNKKKDVWSEGGLNFNYLYVCYVYRYVLEYIVNDVQFRIKYLKEYIFFNILKKVSRL